MIELLQFRKGPGLMNLSPFCMKVEVFLRLSGLEHRCVYEASPFRTPKGKLPVLRDEGRVVADSSAIVAHLQQRYAAQLPPSLGAAETSEQLALRRLLEEHLYFVMLWLRWIDDAGWAFVAPSFFGSMPPGVRQVVPALLRRKVKRDLRGQGTGRHSRDEICERGVADIGAIVAQLGDQPFFGGTEPAAIDATAYAFMANLIWVPLDTPVKAFALTQPTLVAYCERMKARVGLV
jgi:glutathione S-transferase